jgi:membrane associated rhomboid family serine protease
VGIYDRDYFRPTRPDRSLPLPRTVVGTLIAINVAVWIAELICNSQGFPLCDFLATHVLRLRTDVPRPFIGGAWWQADTLTHPWLWWQFLTAGFTHSANTQPGGDWFWHIACNMAVLFFLGPAVEQFYGSKEFLRLYLATLLVSTVTWSAVARLTGTTAAALFGASGAIAGVVVLLALNFPRLTVLFMFIIPMPMWLLGALVVGWDMFGALGGRPGSNVAFTAHLAGAAFAGLYYWRGWSLTGLTRRFSGLGRLFERKPRLHVHRPDTDVRPPSDMSQEVDRILAKISSQGESSLTAKERATLEAASLEYRKRLGKH